MKRCVITLHNEVSCNISGLSSSDRQQLVQLWAIRVHNAQFMPAVEQGRWDGRINFFKSSGNTYINLLGEISDWLMIRGYGIAVVDNRKLPPPSPNHVAFDVFSEFGILLRWYQVEAINRAIDSSKGVLNLATGAGKSLINAALINAYSPLLSMTIVPNVDLVTQTTKTFRKVGLDAGMFYSKKKEIEAQHIVSTWQSLKNHRHILDDRDVIVLDEAHNIKGAILTEIMTEGNGANIPFRFGLTGTIPKPRADQVTLQIAIDVPIYTLAAKQLIDEGHLAQLQIHLYQLADAPPQLKKAPRGVKGDNAVQKAAWKREKTFLTSNTQRIKQIAGIIQSIQRENTSSNNLILIDSRVAGKALAELINCTFIHGDTDTTVRTAEYDSFGDAEGKTLEATFGIAKAGIDIVHVHNVFLVDAGKAFTKVIQSIGRGLRKSTSKTFVDIYDIGSDAHYSSRHMRARIAYYDEESYPYVHKSD